MWCSKSAMAIPQPRRTVFTFIRGIQFEGANPNDYTDTASNEPPFEGTWGQFSWTPKEWKPTEDVRRGSNLVQWSRGFADRFQEGA